MASVEVLAVLIDLCNMLVVLQNATGGTASLRLALEDGHVVLHHTPSDSQVCSSMIYFTNITYQNE
jgi:hypothetical protein